MDILQNYAALPNDRDIQIQSRIKITNILFNNTIFFISILKLTWKSRHLFNGTIECMLRKIQYVRRSDIHFTLRLNNQRKYTNSPKVNLACHHFACHQKNNPRTSNVYSPTTAFSVQSILVYCSWEESGVIMAYLQTFDVKQHLP